MTSFNILGVCTSRDIFSESKRGSKYQVKKYTSGFSPLFVFDEGVKFDKHAYYSVSVDLPLFRRRVGYLDFSRTVFDFIAEESSDYLILDLALLKNSYFLTEDGHYFNYGEKKINLYNQMVKELNFPAIKEKDIPCDFLPTDEVVRRLQLYAKKLLTLYNPDQIILCDHRHCRLYVRENIMRPFRDFDERWYKRDEFAHFCFEVMKNEIKGCHVIDFLSNSVSDLKHRLGISPLHFTKHYYNYCLECIELIIQKLPVDEEIVQLQKIRKKWNRKCAVTYFPMLRNFALSQFDEREKNKRKKNPDRSNVIVPDDYL